MQIYKDLVNKVVKTGTLKKNRTGVDTISLFGESLRFNMDDGFPILTSRKIFFRGSLIEFIWMVVNGDTNIEFLLKNNVKFWTAWPYANYIKINENTGNYIYTIEEFENEILSSPIFSKQYGSIGNGYGMKFRNYNGFDQVENLINGLKTDPLSRRFVLNLFDPNDHFDYNKCILPPCHHETIWNSDGEYLDCTFIMRSNDIMCGLPINICFYGLFLHVIAHICNLKPRTLLYNGVDVHIYTNHIDIFNKYQKNNTLYDLPKLITNNVVYDLYDITPETYELENYKHSTLPRGIKYEVAV